MSYQALLSLLPVAIVMFIGLVPSRRAPSSCFFANQRWGYRELIIVVIITTACEWVGVPGAASLSGARAWALRYGSIAVVTIVGVWIVVRWSHHNPWRSLGFDSTTALYNILWALQIALGGVSALLAIIVFGGVRSLEHASSGSATPAGAAIVGDWMAAFLVTTVLVPVSEELLFRGLAYGPLLRKLGRVGAAVGTAALWASAHDVERGPLGILWVFALGIVYAEVYRRRESLAPTATFHIVSNTVAVFIRGGYLGTLARLLGVCITLWVVSIILSFLVTRSSKSTREHSGRGDAP